MRLSKNFTLSEVTRSNTAKRLGIDNSPKNQHLKNMQRLITNLIQPMRDALGPIRITSGYRSPELNRAIGGSKKSQHSKAEAVDIQFWSEGQMNNRIIYNWVLQSNIEFDQMINEFDYAWIHISLKEKNNRKEVLEAYKDKEGDTAYKFADDIKSL
jgi:zinc D-Ala-D-Ala carboxypeptidase